MLPDKLYIPLVDVKGRRLRPRVKVGDTVQPDQALAYHDDTFIHAPLGGIIESIQPHPMIFHKPLEVDTLVIKVDDSIPPLNAPVSSVFTTQLYHAGIVGMGGAGFSTARKCVNVINSILLNAMECEPLISADAALMQAHPDKILAGIAALRGQYPEADIYFCTELGKAVTLISQLPNWVQIKQLPGGYPAGAERILVKSVLGVTLPPETHASDIGVLCINIGTVAAIGDAIQGKPLTHRMVTITDITSGFSQNRMIPIGTPIKDILSGLGINLAQKKCSQGGQYMPTPIHDIRSPLMKTTQCILVEADLKKKIMPCIRCSACVPVCPEQLLPQQLYWHIKDDNLEAAESYHIDACITCGACDAACPSHIPLANLFSYAKEQISLNRREITKKQESQARYIKREARKSRLHDLREQKKSIKQQHISQEDKKKAIQAALERVKSRFES